MTIKKLKEIPYGQAHVEILDNGGIYLWSYQTLVAEIVDGWFRVRGLYSMTTRRYIGAFAREYAKTDYQMAKQLYQDRMTLNIDTGEVAEIG